MHNSGKPSIQGNTKKVSKKPTKAPIAVPQAIWNDMRLGFGEAADRPTVTEAIRVIMAPLGQSLSSQ